MTTEALDEAQEWLTRDRELLADADGFRTVVSRDDLVIGSRPMPDDPNRLFRWHLRQINAPAIVVFEGFVTRLLDYHAEWTREFAGGRVHSEPRPGVRILYQTFHPGMPGVSRHDLCSAEIVADLPDGAKLASFRSVDALPSQPGYVRIQWWGAALCRPIDADSSELLYLDRENQGGRFPSWLMNRMMPRYLVHQAEQVQRFFADGGPPEIRIHTSSP